MTLTHYRVLDRDEDEHIRRMNEAYDRIHGPARVIPIPPEHRTVSGTPVPGGPHRPWRRRKTDRRSNP
jgi:hypothetical protein